ncbi:MAG: hypothetical protein DI536_28930 [Archangium gephyra]|uniref:Uncharacterized protein n=1 Tax=Archangium gephyra TaxID=48 RepID=A0A2W5T2I5_9BACT|nr:MAG: hypothetical protein DI536_28930 [Archangium gephyra]
MPLSEESVIDHIRVQPEGELLVFSYSRIVRDGVEVARGPVEGRVILPGDDFEAEPNERVRDIARVVHTPAVVAAYQAATENTPPPLPTSEG